MAEIRSELTFEAVEAINTLKRMAAEIVDYNNAINSAAKSTAAYNTAGSKFDKQAAATASSLSRLGKNAADAANKLNLLQAANKAFKSDAAGTQAQIAQLREIQKTTSALGSVAGARQLNTQIAQLELKAQLQLNAAARAQAAVRSKSADPLGRNAPTGQAAIEATVKRIKGSQDAAIASQAKLRADLKQTEIALRNTFRGDNVKSLGNELKETGDKGSKAGRSVLISWESVARIFAIQSIHRFVSLLSNAFSEGITDARDYQTSLAEIRTIGGDLNLTFGELDDEVRAISDTFGQPLDVVAEGVYQTLSNQVGDASDALGFVVSASKFATAAVTDTGSSVNLLSSALNSFNLDVSDTDDVAAKLFKTIELGRVRADELANTFGRVGVLSNQLGISLDETLASIANLTVQGLRFNEAFTLITNTQLKLIRPTDALKKVFNELGVSSAEAGIQAFGFQGFLEKIAETSGGTATEMGELFNRVRAIRGVLGLTGEAGENFRDVLEEIQTATGATTLNDAFAEVFQTDAQRFQREINALKNTFVADFGQTAIAVIVRLGGFFGGLADAVSAIAFGLGVASAAFAVYAAATAIAAINMGAFAASAEFAGLVLVGFLGVPGTIILALGLAAAAASLAYDGLTTSLKESREAQILLNESQERTATNSEKNRRRILATSESNILADTQKFLASRQALFLKDAEIALQIQETGLRNVQQQVKERLATVERFVQGIRDAANDASDALASLEGELQQVGDSLEKFNFDRSIRGLNESQQAFAQIQRSQEAIVALNDAVAKGDTERAKRLAEIAKSSAQAALGSADQANNANLVRRAEEQVRDAIRSEASIIQDAIGRRQQEVVLANKLATQEEARLTRVQVLSDEIAKLEAISKELVISPDFSPDEARVQARDLTGKLQKELQGAAKSADLLGDLNIDFDKLRDQLIAKFREPITGIKIDLTDAIEINLDRIISQLQKQANALSQGERSALGALGAEPDVSGFAEAQKVIQGIPKTIKEAATATQNGIKETANLQNAFLEVNDQVTLLTASLEAIEQRGLLAGAVERDSIGVLRFFTDVAAKVRETLGDALNVPETNFGAENLGIVLQNLVTQFREASEAGDFTQAALTLSQVENIARGLKAAGFQSAANDAFKIAENLQSVAEIFDRLQAESRTAEVLGPLEQQIQRTEGAFEASLQADKAIEDATKRNTEAEKALGIAIDANTRRRQLQADVAASGAGRQFGGMVFRADGGMVIPDRRQFGGQRGSDSVLTSLTPGESVNTLAATRQFFPQIQAMNAGIIPQFRQDGGTVNNNVGDININVSEAATGKDTARQVMKEFKRELRRKTFNLGG